MKENNFAHRISKELVQWMPLTMFEGETVFVNHLEQIPEAMAYLNTQTVVGVDTESRPAFQRGQHFPVALVQIATEERCYLFHLTSIGMPQELADFFANPGILKVGLAFRDDLIGLRRRRDFKPANCIDLQSIAYEYGILDLGLQKMFAIVFGKKISKKQQLTNWENAVLTPEQACYAATDAWTTLLIYKELRDTKKLPKREAERIRREDLEKQQQHQIEVQAQRAAERAKSGNVTEKQVK